MAEDKRPLIRFVPPIIMDLYTYRELMWAMTLRDIRVKYKQAIMGILWLFLLPLLGILAAITVRVAMASLSGTPLNHLQIGQVIVRMTLWLFFAGAVGSSSGSLVGHMDLITKIYFPREVLPVATLLSRLFDFAISLVGVAVILMIMTVIALSQGDQLIVQSWCLLWVIPLLLVLVLFSLGVGLILAAANLFYRDVRYVVEVGIRFGIFFTPVFLFARDFGYAAKLAMLNPLAPLFEGIAAALFAGSLRHAVGTELALWPWLSYSVGCTIVLLVLGCYGFRRAEALFAEYI